MIWEIAKPDLGNGRNSAQGPVLLISGMQFLQQVCFLGLAKSDANCGVEGSGRLGFPVYCGLPIWTQTFEDYVLVPYSQINKLEKAVAAAHTFFVGNPEHVEMRQNLDYYQTMSGVKEADFKDLEAKPHMVKKTLSPPFSLFIKVIFTRLVF